MNVSPEEATGAARTVRVEQIRRIHGALGRALADVGDAASLARAFVDLARLRCLGCGIEVTGIELTELALVTVPDPAAETKIDRLRLGFCARRGCESRYYELAWKRDPGPEVREVVSRTFDLLEAPVEEERAIEETVPEAPWWRQARGRRRLVLGIALLLVLTRWAWHRGWPIPGVHPKSPFGIYTQPVSEPL